MSNPIFSLLDTFYESLKRHPVTRFNPRPVGLESRVLLAQFRPLYRMRETGVDLARRSVCAAYAIDCDSKTIQLFTDHEHQRPKCQHSPTQT